MALYILVYIYIYIYLFLGLAFHSGDPSSRKSQKTEEKESAAQEPIIIEDGPAEAMDCYYTGGWSQWRDDATEADWDRWDWPPANWRPSSHHRSFWDSTSKYHAFCNYEWDENAYRTPPKPSRGWGSPAPTVSTMSRSGSTMSLDGRKWQRWPLSSGAVTRDKWHTNHGDRKRQ